MINRSVIKYYLKKILPQMFFACILFLWQKLLLKGVTALDKVRLKKFTHYHAVTLTYRGLTFKLFISPKNGFIDKYIYLYGVYEPFMLDLFKEHIHPGMTVVDIGANIGQHSMYAGTLVGKHGSVYSFEPIPFLYKQLHDSIKSNHFESIIHAKNIALGEKESYEELHVSTNVGGSSLVNHDDTLETITVHLKNGDGELLSLTRVDVIKIDVEGYEYEVLAGIKQTLHTHAPKIFLEFSGDFYKKQGSNNGGKILALLRDCKYTIFNIEDDMKKITDDEEFLSQFPHILIQTNLLCIVE